MKKKFINGCINMINKHNANFDSTKIAEIKYGLEAIYILITKTIFIFTIAYFLNLTIELLIFVLLYNLIRMPSFGLHATKSSICLFSSSVIFLLVPYVCTIIYMPILSKGIIGIICILLMFKNAPADTYKRPIINKKRRRTYKFLSTIIAIIFALLSLLSQNNFLSNALLLSLVVQCFMVSPMIYKLFKLPYNNYKRYITHNSINVV